MINKVKYIIGKHLNISVCLLFALFSCLIILPYLHGPAYIHQEGWDGRFHMARVAESYLNLSHGHLDQAIPSVMTKTFGSFGYPQNLFYPLITMLPEVLLHIIFGNAYGGYLAFISLIFFSTFMSMYICTLKITKSRFIALLSSALYGFSHFAISITLFYRSFGGSFIFIFMPIAFYGMYQIALKDHKKWWIMSLGVAGLILCDLPDAVVVVLMLVFSFSMTFTVKEAKNIKLTRIVKLIYAGMLSALLSAFFLAPLLQNLLFVKNISVNKLLLSNTVLPTMSVFLTDKLASYSLGLSGLIVVFFVINGWNKFHPALKYLSVVLLINLILVTNIFPWPIFDKYLGFIQFVGRFLYTATFISAFLGAIAIANIVENRKSRYLLVTLFCSIGLLSITSLNFSIKRNPNGNAVNIVSWDDFQNATLNNYVYDYLPHNAFKIKDKLEQHSIPLMNPKKEIQQTRWTTGYDSIHYRINSVQKYTDVVLPNIFYPGFTVYVNGEKMPEKYNKNNAIVVPIEKGISKIDVKYVKTPVQIISFWISVIALLTLIVLKNKKLTKLLPLFKKH